MAKLYDTWSSAGVGSIESSPPAFPADTRYSFIAWTTTPWTLPANVALALNPTATYEAVRTQNGEVLIVAASRSEALMTFTGAKAVKQNQRWLQKGENFAGLSYRRPFSERELGRVVTDGSVSLGEGIWQYISNVFFGTIHRKYVIIG
jgi:isoleucyl-tRNA synthetase